MQVEQVGPSVGAGDLVRQAGTGVEQCGTLDVKADVEVPELEHRGLVSAERERDQAHGLGRVARGADELKAWAAHGGAVRQRDEVAGQCQARLVLDQVQAARQLGRDLAAGERAEQLLRAHARTASRVGCGSDSALEALALAVADTSAMAMARWRIESPMRMPSLPLMMGPARYEAKR